MIFANHQDTGELTLRARRGAAITTALVGSIAGLRALADGMGIGLHDLHAHAEREGGEESCGSCHHQNLPFDRASTCGSCHADMFLVSDTFEHQVHVERLGGNASCTECHEDGDGAKSRDGARACGDCHQDMLAEGSIVAPRAGGIAGYAVGYADAVHGLCVACHERELAQRPGELPESLADCGTCHGRDDVARLRRLGPYRAKATRPNE